MTPWRALDELAYDWLRDTPKADAKKLEAFHVLRKVVEECAFSNEDVRVNLEDPYAVQE